MATIIIPTFKGMTPRTHERLLQPGQAQVATNCRTDRGILEALFGLGASVHSGSSGTIFKHPGLGWMSWPGAVSVINSAVVDSGGHFFVTGDGYPKQSTTSMGGSYRRLGIPAPTSPLSVQLSEVYIEPEPEPEPELDENGDPIESDEEDEETTVDTPDVDRSSSYCYTYVVDMGEGGMQESAPSPPTGVFDVLEGQDVTLTGFAVPSTAGVTVSKYRLYRTVGGNSSASFFFLDEINVGMSSWSDTLTDDQVSTETLATAGWDMPEDDATGIILTPNGIYAMHRTNEILLSEPFVPYAYPQKYRLATQDPIVGLGFFESSIVALTEGRPFLLMGSTPESMSMQPMPFDQACVSAASIVSMDQGVMYASPDGLCLVGAGGQQVVTRGVFTKEQWQALGPEGMRGACYEDKYFGILPDGTGVVYDFVTQSVFSLDVGAAISATYHDIVSDTLFVCADGSVRGLGASTVPLKYTWRSGEFFTSALVLPSALRIEGGQTPSAPIKVRLFANGQKRQEFDLLRTEAVRVATRRSEKNWTIEVEGTTPIFEIRLSTSIEELENGK